jgi:hypothetical protein
MGMENPTEVIPQNYQISIDRQKQNIFLLAEQGDSWITYRVDKEPIKSYVLSKGKNLFLQGDLIKIQLGNVKVIKTFYNNKLLYTPSVAGTKSLVFPPASGEKSYLVPLFIHYRSGGVVTAEEYLRKKKLEQAKVKDQENTTNTPLEKKEL